MSIRHFGIYLTYAPNLDLRDQGLGRYLVMFLKGAAELGGVQFTIVCPSWTKETLETLFKDERVPKDCINIVAPIGKPFVLRMYEFLRRADSRPEGNNTFRRIALLTKNKLNTKLRLITLRVVKVHDLKSLLSALPSLALSLFIMGSAVALITPLVLLFAGIRSISAIVYKRFTQPNSRLGAPINFIKRLIFWPKNNFFSEKIFKLMQSVEIDRMHDLMTRLTYVRAWYCPTAFWPHFNQIHGPRLMCVPDVVLTDFPSGFSKIGGDRLLDTFKDVETSILTGKNFTTYSQAVKWRTLVDHYGVASENVTVIPHAPSCLDGYIQTTGFSNNEETSKAYCQGLLRSALQKSTNSIYTSTFANMDVSFLFYASQFRPNKNVLLLLKAYRYLLRTQFIGHKLLLTGNPDHSSDIKDYIYDNYLDNDVIFLPGLTISELAACYKLADLAVNPSLSEGGCPFTFTEALSVGTPVVMAKIDVTKEVLTDPELQLTTLFDPFNWKDCANKIEWALHHRDDLLLIQTRAFNKLCKRSWQNVVSEHVDVLEAISKPIVH
jgi:glycosyltransferase involved in cell wall biosynthesis